MHVCINRLYNLGVTVWKWQVMENTVRTCGLTSGFHVFLKCERRAWAAQLYLAFYQNDTENKTLNESMPAIEPLQMSALLES